MRTKGMSKAYKFPTGLFATKTMRMFDKKIDPFAITRPPSLLQ